tara:strand:- start:467 stop:925 length:459 start_codon:yes stop_codon:yes gene_type:complete
MSEFANRSIGVGMKATRAFFNVSRVTDRIDPVKRRLLFKFGGLTKTIARRSIRPGGKQNKVSSPGETPRYHKTTYFKKSIRFSVNKQKETVVIGPVGNPMKGVPKLLQGLEYGGDFVSSKGKRFKVSARPFMNPAFEKTKSKISELWSQSGG